MKRMPSSVWVEQCEDGSPGRAFLPDEWNNTNRLRTKYVEYIGPTYSKREVRDFMQSVFGNGTITSSVLTAFDTYFEEPK
jgi:hypothetical protein